MTSTTRSQRIHLSSWVVCALAVVVFALIAVPGMIQLPDSAWYHRYSHGWPAEYLGRDVVDASVQMGNNGEYLLLVRGPTLLSAPEPAPWLSLDGWRLWHAEELQWHWLNLAFDVSIGAAIIGIATAAWEWRRRRSSRLLQFSLADMAVCAAMFAVVLAYWKFQVREAAQDQLLAETLDLEGVYFEQGIVAPEWLQRLVGPEKLTLYYNRVVKIAVGPEELDRMQELAPNLVQLRQLHTLYFGSTAGRELTETFSTLSHIASLRVVDFSGVNRSDLLFDENAVESLTRLTRLRELRFYAEDEPKPELLAAIRENLPDCRITFESD